MSFAALYEHIINLDVVLTGKTHSEAAQTARHQAHIFNDAERFLHNQEVYYLSDGGYSRVFISYEGDLLLTQNSLDKVKARWATPEGVEAREQFRAAVIALSETDAPADTGATNPRRA
ncbi:hypothetical protein O9X98_10390 [Agrobacterium salinitolerans]|nr:hypothetical protein [Agrobacterium salinitolerans]